MKKANTAQDAEVWMRMLRFFDGDTGIAGAIGERGGVFRWLRRLNMLVVLGVLAVIAGFEAVTAVAFLWGTWSLPLAVVLAGSLLSLLFLGFITMLTRAENVGSPQAISPASLLGREAVSLQTAEAYALLRGRTILVTGAAGSIGSELCRQLLDFEPKLVIALDSNETGLFDLAESLRSHAQSPRLTLYIDDITDAAGMRRLFTKERPEIIFHAAAYKHVPLLERYPNQAIRTNVLATHQLCHLAQEHRATHFVFISSDKAADPIGVMGATKRLGELMIQALAKSENCETRFCAVRFGNVLGSRGSVVPVFAQQIEQGGPVTVTHPDATRFFMTIPEACGLVILTGAMADRGALYLLDMGNPVRILDLAIKMIRLRNMRVGQDIPIVYTGLRPGERLHETLQASHEELLPTTHHKVFSIASGGILPTQATVARWIETLDYSLRHEGTAELREHLFEIVQEQKLTVSS